MEQILKVSELHPQTHVTHVAEYKREIVNMLVDLINKYPIIGIVNMENLPAPQLQAMRAQLRGKFIITMTKRRLIKLAFEQTTNKKAIKKLESYLGGMPALIFTKENPFRLSKTLQKSKSPAPAKAGQTAPRDIIINKGATPFAPGPIIGELALAGIKAGVEAGKVAIKEDMLVVKAGEKIKPKIAEILTRLGIQPMEVGLDLVAVYENELIYTRNVLSIDESEYKNRLMNAERWAFNFANFIVYPTKETIKLLLGKAYKSAKALGVAQNIFDDEIIDALLDRAEQQMRSLAITSNFQIVEIKHETEKQVAKQEVIKHKAESKEITVPTREELEANIKMREKQREVKEVEKIYHEIHKKAIEEQEKKN